jgi:hypothetical protein
MTDEAPVFGEEFAMPGLAVLRSPIKPWNPQFSAARQQIRFLLWVLDMPAF